MIMFKLLQADNVITSFIVVIIVIVIIVIVIIVTITITRSGCININTTKPSVKFAKKDKAEKLTDP